MSTSTNHFNLLSYLNCYVKEKRKIAMHHFERLTSFFFFFVNTRPNIRGMHLVIR